MSVTKEVRNNQFEAIGLAELSELERVVLQLFRLLDETGQKDILRFMNVILSSK
ncbi:hypothetical protein [Pseudomonas brassicacearum]|uniref:hypothetical protein n=1 Tax=Pseudomonas brassicacearum TaxID=930166 RepID=UPI001BDDEE84|nr:hypothetical protein [Pseudomonas brassicacearum]